MAYDYYLVKVKPTGATASLDVGEILKRINKKMYDYASENFNGFTKNGDWTNITNGYKCYFSLNDEEEKNLEVIVRTPDSNSQQLFMGLCSTDHDGAIPPDGLMIYESAISWISDMPWPAFSDDDQRVRTFHFIVDKDDDNKIVAISIPEIGYEDQEYGYSTPSGRDDLFFFDRKKDIVLTMGYGYYFTSNWNIDMSTDKIIAWLYDSKAIIGNLIAPLYVGSDEGIAMKQNILFNDIYNNTNQYNGSIALESLSNSNINGYFNYQRIRLNADNTTHIHVGDQSLFVEYDEYHVVNLTV